MSGNLRVLHIIDATVGGTRTYIGQVLTELARRGWNIRYHDTIHYVDASTHDLMIVPDEWKRSQVFERRVHGIHLDGVKSNMRLLSRQCLGPWRRDGIHIQETLAQFLNRVFLEKGFQAPAVSRAGLPTCIAGGMRQS